ncbi:uncharacterized protein LOC113520759 [Galleria mellonella]|uniref:Gustatory receptor n=1 Tax=Galleria mellonella TaxID=7137 RepID=A0ABM3M869_GALME|nr:uncharacterized protein LOC113520759 [Galleria mellonella]
MVLHLRKKKIPFVYERNIKFQDIFYPIYLSLRLFGLFPYKIKYKYGTKKYKILHKSIYLNALCAVLYNLVIIVLVVVHVHVIAVSNKNGSIAPTLMTTINYTVQIVTLMSSCVIAYICAYQNRCNYVKILNKLSSSWFALPNTNYYILKKLHTHVLICLLILTMILLSLISFTCTQVYKGGIWETLLIAFTFNMPQFIQFVVIVFYYTLMLMVRAILSNMKENCLNTIKEKKNPKYSIKIVAKKSTFSITYLELFYVQVTEIARALHNIPIDQNVDIMMQVQRFSTLMSYYNPIVSVYDFFPLDATLIFNVLASATTYLIIFVQFENN